jgi:hypothetical protein
MKQQDANEGILKVVSGSAVRDSGHAQHNESDTDNDPISPLTSTDSPRTRHLSLDSKPKRTTGHVSATSLHIFGT